MVRNGRSLAELSAGDAGVGQGRGPQPLLMAYSLGVWSLTPAASLPSHRSPDTSAQATLKESVTLSHRKWGKCPAQ